MDENCMLRKCKECSRQIRCSQATCEEHNFIQISSNSLYITYKCSHCGYRERRMRNESKSNG